MLNLYSGEDTCYILKGSGADKVATLTGMALQVLDWQKDKKYKSRRKLTGWNDEYLLNMIQCICSWCVYFF